MPYNYRNRELDFNSPTGFGRCVDGYLIDGPDSVEDEDETEE